MTVPMAMLTLLEPGPAHGFALKRRYDELLGTDKDLKFGQVYSTLARLERDGYATGVGFESAGAAERRVFAITESGVSELDRWLRTPTVPGGRPSELFTRVVLALVSGRPAQELLAVYEGVRFGGHRGSEQDRALASRALALIEEGWR